jgi:hypothetical protein
VRAIGVLLATVVAVSVLTNCTAKPKPAATPNQTWVLVNIPARRSLPIGPPPSPPAGFGAATEPCQVLVLSALYLGYAVAVLKGPAGEHKPPSGTSMYKGEEFSVGTLELGPATVHDDSNGYDFNIEVLYKTADYEGAISRADAACDGNPRWLPRGITLIDSPTSHP